MGSVKNNEYIDLMEIAKSIWTYKFILVALAVVIALISVVRVEFFTKDKYVAYGVVYVSNGQTQDSDIVSQSAIDTARTMIETSREILKTRSFLTEVSMDIDEKYSWGQIKGMTSITAQNETELMRISVTAYSPTDAYNIANSIVERAPERLTSVFKSGTAEVIDSVIPPTSAVSKGVTGEAVKGAILG
ncbi:MAG: hypothetical protein IJZ20_01880, partial [Clostridia bacterium]|nr:hypothetical protein [Clostridia bacterium]